jgi:hypothetical protein
MKRTSLIAATAFSLFGCSGCTVDAPAPGTVSGQFAGCPYPNSIGINMSGKHWGLIWNDEFDGSGLPNADKWMIDIGRHYPSWPWSDAPYLMDGWLNNEVQNYSSSTANVRVENGRLRIAANRSGLGAPWYSGRIETRQSFCPEDGGAIAVEAKIQLPSGQTGLGKVDGYWPAFWMMGDCLRSGSDSAYGHNMQYESWPFCGEIDIADFPSYTEAPTTFVSGLHCGSYTAGPCNERNGIVATGSCGGNCGSGSTSHVFRLEWSKTLNADGCTDPLGRMAFYVDDSPVGGGTNYAKNIWSLLYSNPNPFDPSSQTMIRDDAWAGFVQPFFIVLNLALKGDGTPAGERHVDYAYVHESSGYTTPSDMPMFIDYVRVYKLYNNTDPTGPNLIPNGGFDAPVTTNWYAANGSPSIEVECGSPAGGNCASMGSRSGASSDERFYMELLDQSGAWNSWSGFDYPGSRAYPPTLDAPIPAQTSDAGLYLQFWVKIIGNDSSTNDYLTFQTLADGGAIVGYAGTVFSNGTLSLGNLDTIQEIPKNEWVHVKWRYGTAGPLTGGGHFVAPTTVTQKATRFLIDGLSLTN